MTQEKQIEKNFKIRIELFSEAIFTSGDGENNLVQTKAQTDEYGFVYLHAKTLKGQLKNHAIWLLKQYIHIDVDYAKKFYDALIYLFGISKKENKKILEFYDSQYICDKQECQGALKISNLMLNKKIRDEYKLLYENDEKLDYFNMSPNDIIEAQTNVRTYIQLENGLAKEKMLNTFHTIKKGLVFYSDISFICGDKPNQSDENLTLCLYEVINSFRRLGAGIHSGRGEVKSSLIDESGKIILYEN